MKILKTKVKSFVRGCQRHGEIAGGEERERDKVREKKGEMKVKAFLFIILIEVHDDTESEIEERERITTCSKKVLTIQIK